MSDLLRKDGKLDEARELCKRGKEIAEKEVATSPLGVGFDIQDRMVAIIAETT